MLNLHKDGTIEFPWEDKQLRVPRPKAMQYAAVVSVAESIQNRLAEQAGGSKNTLMGRARDVLQGVLSHANGETPIDPKLLRDALEAFDAVIAAPEVSEIDLLYVQMAYEPFWAAVFANILPRETYNKAELEAWLLNPTAVAAVIEHWTHVPLALGTTPAQQAVLEGRPMTDAEKRADGIT